jgi:hypothetical protein
MVLHLAEVLAREHLLRAHDLRTLLGGLFNERRLMLAIGGHIFDAAHLREAQLDDA